MDPSLLQGLHGRRSVTDCSSNGCCEPISIAEIDGFLVRPGWHQDLLVAATFDERSAAYLKQ